MNVVVIVTDSLRADHCGPYPHGREYQGRRVATPNMDRLAADGTVFLHAYSESLPTLPTRTTWWTGRVGFPFRGWQPFEPDDYLLAEVLWDRGYTSALVTDTYHMHKPVYNCGRGFDSVVWVRGQEYDPYVVDGRPVDPEQWHRLRGDETDAVWGPRFKQYLRNRDGFSREEDWFAPRVTTEAIRWLDDTITRRGLRDRLFLWVDYFDPHEPWDPPEPYWSMYRDPAYRGPEIIDPVPGLTDGYLSESELERIRSLYAGEVTFVDHWVGRLLDHLRTLGLYEDTLVLWLSDHGEPFGEHGIIRKARPWPYEELVHIPWIMKLPAALSRETPPPKTVDALVQPTDLMPTLLDALGIRTPLPLVYQAPRTTGTFPQDVRQNRAEVAFHGHSLLPLLRGETDQIRKFAVTGHHSQSWSLQDHQWRFILFIDGSRSPELYHRPTDPYDQRNAIAENPEVAAALELELRRWVAGLDRPRP